MNALRDQRGFTVVEAVVAALLVLIGLMAVFQMMDTAQRTNYRAAESQTLNNRLQAELEKITHLPYDQVALTTTPSTSTDHNDPRWRVNGANYAVSKDGTNARPMSVDAQNGVIAPGPTPYEVGGVSGNIYRFVVWMDDPGCGAACPGTQDLKRVVVAATVDEAPVSYSRVFQEVQTNVTDPDSTPLTNPPPPTNDQQGSTTQFWLTDTPATPCNTAVSRVAPSADHAAHNTRGLCSSGAQTGTTRGAADLMFTEAPPLNPTSNPLYDYATDSEPSSGASSDVGFRMQAPAAGAGGCLLQSVYSLDVIHRVLSGLPVANSLLSLLPAATDGVLDLGGTNPQWKQHTWVTNPITNGSAVALGHGSLDLWTQTDPGQAATSATICVMLFVRTTINAPYLSILGIQLTTPLTVDVPLVNTGNVLHPTYFEYTKNPWPSAWTPISIPLDFAAIDANNVLSQLHLSASSRIGVTVMIKRPATGSAPALQFMYDHPGFDSRLSLQMNPLVTF